MANFYLVPPRDEDPPASMPAASGAPHQSSVRLSVELPGKCWRCGISLYDTEQMVGVVGGVCSTCEDRIEEARRDPMYRGPRFEWRGLRRGGVLIRHIIRFEKEAGIQCSAISR